MAEAAPPAPAPAAPPESLAVSIVRGVADAASYWPASLAHLAPPYDTGGSDYVTVAGLCQAAVRRTPQAVLAYLLRYKHRVANSSSRLVAMGARGVSFRWKDYRAKGRTRHKTRRVVPADDTAGSTMSRPPWRACAGTACAGRIEDWHRVLKSGCAIEALAHKTRTRLERAIAIRLVIGWRIMLMTLLGRTCPELPAEVLFSDIEIEVLTAYAKKND